MGQLRGFLLRFRPGQPLWSFCDSTHHNRVADILENILGYGCRIDKPTDGTPWKIVIDGSSDIVTGADGEDALLKFPWGSKYTFGITQTASNKIKVWNGKLRRWGDQVYSAANTEVTFSGDGDQYIVWKWSASSGLIIATAPQTNWPVESDSTYQYGAVHKVNLTNGKFTLLESIQTGIINAPIFSKGDA